MKLAKFTDLLNFEYLKTYNTVLIGGFDEPLYVPENQGEPAQIRFTRDYYRSALHELAHWCIAGAERRKMEDYGYWYVPDGRTQRQQDAFYRCEIKPQAVEWALSIVCDVKFDVSVDNINNPVTGTELFKKDVSVQFQHYLENGFPLRCEEILHFIHQSEICDSTGVYGLLNNMKFG